MGNKSSLSIEDMGNKSSLSVEDMGNKSSLSVEDMYVGELNSSGQTQTLTPNTGTDQGSVVALESRSRLNIDESGNYPDIRKNDLDVNLEELRIKVNEEARKRLNKDESGNYPDIRKKSHSLFKDLDLTLLTNVSLNIMSISLNLAHYINYTLKMSPFPFLPFTCYRQG